MTATKAKNLSWGVPKPSSSTTSSTTSSTQMSLVDPEDYDEGTPLAKTGRCYETHPPLPIKTEQGEYKVYGGSCGYPVKLDADIYVALQAGSRVRLPMPWEPGFGQIVQIDYPITDGSTPKSSSEFKLMIDWLCNQLRGGKSVHIGCIGGHGRTGTVMAAIVATMMPEVEDAVEYVRNNYCHKAVESKTQVAFLVKHFKVKHVEPSKEELRMPASGWGASSNSGGSYGRTGSWPKTGGAAEFSAPKSSRFTDAVHTINPVPSRRNIFVQI